MLSIGVIGATGAVGREMLVELSDSAIDAFKLVPMASPKSAGTTLSCRGESYSVQAFELGLARKCDYVLMSAGSEFSRKWAEKITADGGPILVDNSSAWRLKADVPLVVPEVNVAALQSGARIIANPNCAMIQLAVGLKPLKDAFGIDFVHVVTMQSVSGSGLRGIDELNHQVGEHFKFEELTCRLYSVPIAFNLVPFIGAIDSEGHCGEELKVVRELRKVFATPDLDVHVSTVRAPVYNCHSEAVLVRLAKKVALADIHAVLDNVDAIDHVVSDNPREIPTPRATTGERGVFLSRVRLPPGCSESRFVQFWSVADNLKKGAATNAVQILECLVEQYSRPQ